MILLQQIPSKEVNSLVESLKQIGEMEHSQQSEWSVNGGSIYCNCFIYSSYFGSSFWNIN